MTNPSVPDPARSTPSDPADGSARTSSRERSLLSDTQALMEPRRQRFGSAFGLSMVSHGLAVALVILIGSLLPRPEANPFLPDLRNYDIVWLPAEGPGGGGGGGGSETPEPPRQVELPGRDEVSVPVVETPPPEPPSAEPPPEPEPEPEQELKIPAMTLGAAEQTVAGVLEGLPAATVSQGPGTGGGGGTGAGTGIGPGEGDGLGPGTGGGTGGGIYRPGSGVQMPRVLREVKPQYTADAMRAKVQGVVELECVILPDGTVGRVEVIRSLDPVFGLDQEAVKAVRQWQFAPAMRLGEPVAFLATIELTFTLR